MKFTLGTKEKMSQYFNEDGKVFPVSVLNIGPIVVTNIRTNEKNGYSAVQVGFGFRKEKNISKAVQGSLKEIGNFKFLKEFRVLDPSKYKIGEKIDVSNLFTEGDKISVSSVSKGKGFQGVVKRHGFKGGPRTHGQKHSEREPGSIGGGLRTRVPKGMRMAGRMGGDRITQKNLKVVFIDKENNLMLVKGAIAGRRGTLVEIVSK